MTIWGVDMGALTFWKPWSARLGAALGKCGTADKVGKRQQAWAAIGHWAKGSAPSDPFLASPVFLALGIGAWFGLQAEPALPFYLAMAAVLVGLAGLVRFGPWLCPTYRAAQALAAALLPRTTRAGAWVIAKAMVEVERGARRGREEV